MAPITPNPIAQDEAIFRNSSVNDCSTLPIRLFASDDEHLALLGELLDVFDVLLDFGAHRFINIHRTCRIVTYTLIKQSININSPSGSSRRSYGCRSAQAGCSALCCTYPVALYGSASSFSRCASSAASFLQGQMPVRLPFCRL